MKSAHIPDINDFRANIAGLGRGPVLRRVGGEITLVEMTAGTPPMTMSRFLAGMRIEEVKS